MKRRSPLALIAVVAATLTGCTTFSDNDAAARVGDVEYSHEDLAAELEGFGATEEQLATADIVRGQVGAWVAARVEEAKDPVLVASGYAKGLFESGVVCVDLIATDSAESADRAVADLAGGADFVDVFEASNIDPGLAQTSGHAGCPTIADLAPSMGTPLVDSITTINSTNPFTTAFLPGPTTADDVYVVSRFVPFDELGPDETPIVTGAVGALALDLDIYVDPQIGVYDGASATVIPLG